MNIQRKNSAHHFRMQSEREQTLVKVIHLVNYGIFWEYNDKTLHNDVQRLEKMHEIKLE